MLGFENYLCIFFLHQIVKIERKNAVYISTNSTRLKIYVQIYFFCVSFLCFCVEYLIPLILIHNKYLKVLMRTWNNLMAVRSTIKKSSTQIRACRKYSSSLRRIKKRKKVVFNNQLKFISFLNLFYGMEWSKWCPT